MPARTDSRPAAIPGRTPSAPPSTNGSDAGKIDTLDGAIPGVAEQTDFAAAVIRWFETHGRHDLPWQTDSTPYRVWVSEIMLQQTRVSTVIPYFRRFMERFPDVAALAAADIDQVLHLWSGLGYYARARNLHLAARAVVEEHGGEFPDTLEKLTRMPGIGRSTAGAVLALAHGRRAPILDGNVKRVLARCFAVEGYPGTRQTAAELWALAERILPPQSKPPTGSDARDTHPKNHHAKAGRSPISAYTQGLMDLGATLCTRANPACPRCPLRGRCLAWRRGETERFPGKKPKKSLPTRSAIVFIPQDGAGRILLEKRPPTGVWGSLYSPPQIDLPLHIDVGTPAAAPGDDKIAEALSGAFDRELKLPAGLRIAAAPRVALPPIRHGFTHFHLEITPILCRLDQATPGVADSNRWLWYSTAKPREVGLAAPMRKLLASLATAQRRNTQRKVRQMRKSQP